MDTLTVKDLAANEQKALKGLKQSVSTLAGGLDKIRTSARDLAPKVMKLFTDLTGAHGQALGGFVGFARLFDPSMPLHGADKQGIVGYRKNKTYYALDYMRRLGNMRPRGTQGKRDMATDQLARTLATILQFVKNPEPIYAALEREFRFNTRMIARVKARVLIAEPLIDLKGIRPITVTEQQIIHVAPASEAQPVAATAKVAKKQMAKAA